MPRQGALRLGPVARKLLSPDKWTDGYPAREAFSRELDALLHWANLKGCLFRFVGPLESRNHQRDEALNELRLAYFFDSLGYPVIQWDPPGANGKIGEFLLDTPGKVPVFTELKSPGWEGELSPAQLKAGRQHLPKYNGLDGGAVGNHQPVHRCMASPKTYPKFTDSQAGLLIISDDLRVSLHDTLFQVEGALYGANQQYGEDGCFASNQFENIGGLGVFCAYSSAPSRGLEYKFVIYENPYALQATRLPQGLLDEFKATFTCVVKGTDPRRPAPLR